MAKIKRIVIADIKLIEKSTGEVLLEKVVEKSGPQMVKYIKELLKKKHELDVSVVGNPTKMGYGRHEWATEDRTAPHQIEVEFKEK